MGNCCKSCELYHKERRNITLVITGLDNSGKTTMAKRLAGEPVDSVLKTLGFSLIVLHYHGYRISLYDIGGSPEIRDIWNKYFMDAHGLIFVVDASDITRLAEAKSTFANLLSHENVSGKPVLLLANKQDKENVLDELEIVEQLDVEYVVNKYRCLTRVEICSALGYENGKIDAGIKNGFRWLIDNVTQNYKVLDERVQRDMADFAAQVQKDKDAWRSRVKTKSDSESVENVCPAHRNPFQPINQLIKSSNGRLPGENDANISRNGDVRRPVLIDNYVRVENNESHVNKINNSASKTETNQAQRSVMNAVTETIKDKKSKLNQQYHRHKRKFSRFNKTAPMPIDVIIRDESSDIKQTRETSNYSVKSNVVCRDINGVGKYGRNYLSRRPATAPSSFNFSTIKVNAAWDLTPSLEISTSSSSKVFFVNNKDPDAIDVISFF